MKPTLEKVTAAILDASSRLAESSNTRYPFNCADAAITCDESGNVFCGTNMHPADDETLLMDEDRMSAEITPEMSDADAQYLAEQLILELEESE